MDYLRRNGRMPVKAEKEPIRHLYELYNSIKQQISVLENQPRHVQLQQQQRAQQREHSKSPTRRRQSPQKQHSSRGLGRTNSVKVSPVTNGSNQNTINGGKAAVEAAPQQRSSNNTDGGASSTAATTQQRQKGPATSLRNGNIATAVTTKTLQQQNTNNLTQLKAEKERLHKMLRNYERQFYREHKRQVSSFTDIKPVATQYRRYKEVKKTISSMERRQNEWINWWHFNTLIYVWAYLCSLNRQQ